MNEQLPKDTLSRHTPGPWTWEVHPIAKRVQIVGRGMTVMDFVRWGMTGAAPRFLSREHLLDRADELLQVVPGREHHAHWHQTINHPDARLIAAAPDLLEALQVLLPGLMLDLRYADDDDDKDALRSRIDTVVTAIKKATNV